MAPAVRQGRLEAPPAPDRPYPLRSCLTATAAATGPPRRKEAPALIEGGGFNRRGRKAYGGRLHHYLGRIVLLGVPRPQGIERLGHVGEGRAQPDPLLTVQLRQRISGVGRQLDHGQDEDPHLGSVRELDRQHEGGLGRQAERSLGHQAVPRPRWAHRAASCLVMGVRSTVAPGTPPAFKASTLTVRVARATVTAASVFTTPCSVVSSPISVLAQSRWPGAVAASSKPLIAARSD